MYYEESKKILEEIIKAKKILLNCHRRPDPDSISSALAMFSVLSEIGKTVEIVCPDPVPEMLNYLDNYDTIKQVNFDELDFSPYGLFIVLDSGTWDVVTDNENIPPPKRLNIIKIDHHDRQEKFENLSIINNKASSTSEIVYQMFKDWGITTSVTTANALLSGIIADSICFSIPLTTSATLDAASDLIKIGADKDLIMDRQFNSMDIKLLKFFGEVLKRIQYDEKYKFVWSAVPFSVFSECGSGLISKNAAANMFFAKVKDSLFGVLMVEEKSKLLGVSFRSAGRFDTSKIALALGGGGHHDSSASKIEGLDFDEAVNNVLDRTREMVKNVKKI